MVEPSAQQPSSSAHLVLFDGVCGLCNRLLRFLLRHDRRRVFKFASLQSAIGQSIVERSGRNPRDLTSFYAVVDYEQPTARLLTKSDAALFVASELGWPWKATCVFRGIPHRVRDRAYDLLARHRYELFGKYDQCLIPGPEVRSRFID